MRIQRSATKAVFWTVGLLVAVIYFIPVAWMIVTSLKATSQIFSLPPTLLPKPVHWSNYPAALQSAPFARYFLNSMIVSACSVAVNVFVSCLAGYALARLQFRGRQGIFIAILATIMVPPQLTIVPLFILLRHFPLAGGNGWDGNGGLGLLDSFPGLILPYAAGAFGIFLMRQFFLTLPKDLEDSARVEGASEFRIFASIMLPLVRPAMATLAVFVFQGAWNDFLWPLVIVNHNFMYTLQLGLTIFQQEYTTNWGLLMAATTMASVPVIIIFLFAQRTFTAGIALTGLKT